MVKLVQPRNRLRRGNTGPNHGDSAQMDVLLGLLEDSSGGFGADINLI